jgi:hypothetical protein
MPGPRPAPEFFFSQVADGLLRRLRLRWNDASSASTEAHVRVRFRVKRRAVDRIAMVLSRLPYTTMTPRPGRRAGRHSATNDAKPARF